jgi:mono/diheme cytochrome c family protein
VGATASTPPNLANVKTTTHGVLSVIDLTTNTEITGGTASLHAHFDAFFTARGLADDGSRRYPLVPTDVAFVAGTNVAYVAANGSDAAFRVRYAEDTGALAEVGSSVQPFIDLAPSGKNPIGVETSHTGKAFMITGNDVSRSLGVVDLNAQAVAKDAAGTAISVASSALPAPGSNADHVLRGKRFFTTGTGRWSLKGQGWGACQSCHMDGLSDNVTWYFARGPRQSTSLDGTFSKKDPSDQRILNWTAINDEVADFELNTRGISGGVGAIVSANSTPPAATDRIDIQTLGHAGLSGSAAQAADPANPLGLAAASVLDDWRNITEYVKTIRSPRAPSNLDTQRVDAGRALFQNNNCQGCHGGDKWTLSRVFYNPSPATALALKTTSWTPPAGFPATLLPAQTPANRVMRFGGANPAAFDQIQCVLRPVGTFGVADAQSGIAEIRQDMTTGAQGNEADGNGYNPPSLLGVSLGAPFFHAGNAATLESLLSPAFKAHYAALAPNFLEDADPTARAEKVDALIQFLLSIDAETKTLATPAAGSAGGDFCRAP